MLGIPELMGHFFRGPQQLRPQTTLLGSRFIYMETSGLFLQHFITLNANMDRISKSCRNLRKNYALGAVVPDH
jgi:hypothetical protein